MAKKLGELLVETGVITPDQLRAALRAQLQRGGHLGTCLIELKYVDENHLGQALAELHQVEHATAEQFAFISQSVIERVPTRIVERRRVIPLNIQQNALRVAMANPGDLLTLDELAFSTGLNISPCVAPEVRIVQALERYYGIPRSPRFLMIGTLTANPRPAPLSPTGTWDSVAVIPLAADPQPQPQPKSQPRQQLQAEPMTTRTAPVATDPKPVRPSPRPPDPLAREPQTLPEPEPFHTPREDSVQRRIVQELFQRPPGPGADIIRSRQPRPVNEGGLLGDFDRVGDTLCEAVSPGAIARATLDCAARGLRRCMLLAVRSMQARVWDWRGIRLDPDSVEGLRFPVEASGIFELVAGSEWYRGEIPQRPSQVKFYHDLNLPVPTEALIVPVYFEEHLAAMLYGDGGEGSIIGDSDVYVRLAEKMGIALSLLALKRKMRQV